MRMHAVGLMEKDVCAMPFTQADIADALGLSNVHVSRVLGRLRKKGLFTWQDGVLTIKNWQQLQKEAEFTRPIFSSIPSSAPTDWGRGSGASALFVAGYCRPRRNRPRSRTVQGRGWIVRADGKAEIVFALER